MTKAAAKPTERKLRLVDDAETEPGRVVPGGYLVSDEQLKKLGHGDVKQGRRWLRLFMSDALTTPKITAPTAKQDMVRVADEGDELALFDMAVESYKENASSLYPVDPEQIIDTIQHATRQRGSIAGVIDDQDGNPIAFVMIRPSPWAESNAWMLMVRHIYVKPQHRKSHHAEHLIKFARWCRDEWSRQFGYPLYLSFTVSEQKDVSSKMRFFRRFAKQVACVFLYPDPQEE